MNDYTLSKKFEQIINQLNQLTYESEDLTQLDRIQQLKYQIDQYFPQARTTVKFNGKIEDILIRIHSKFENRILVPDENFDILMNVYISESYQIHTSDIQQIQDCLLLHFPDAQFRFEILKTEAIDEDNLLVILDFRVIANT